MENLDTKIQELLKKYQDGKCTPQEVDLLEHLYNLSAQSSLPANMSDQDYKQIFDEIWLKPPFYNKPYELWKGTILKSVAMVAAIFIAIFIFRYNNQDQPEKSQNYSTDINPGGNKAVLTLADGKKIILGNTENGKIAEQTGIKINKTAAGEIIYEAMEAMVSESTATSKPQYNTIETPVGGKYQVRLPDGTKVWLNALSSITYPVTLNSGSERQLSLVGEAYFQVSPDKHRPFIINTNNQQVVVLGTHFNINSYTDEQMTKTTLIEGKVKVINNDSGREDFLKPGEQSVVQSASTIINKVEEEEALDWVNDKIIFNNEPLADIMRKVARWYNIEVTFRDGTEKITFMGAVSRNKKISAVLNYFKSTETVDFTLKDNRIIVTKKK